MVALTFPPKPLRDLSPFGIRSPTQTKEFLLAMQRAGAAALGVFLFYRYGASLQTRMPELPMQDYSNLLILLGAGSCLSAPAISLGWGSYVFIKGAVNILALSQERTGLALVGNVCRIVWGYYLVQEEGTQKLSIPFNLLDRVFVAIAQRYSGPVFDRFFA